MPTPIYTFTTRGHNLSGNIRCANQAEAQMLYDALADGVSSGKEFVELSLGSDKTTIRTSQISGFSISVHMEETQEEIKQRQIAQIEQGCTNSDYYGSPQTGLSFPKNYLGSGLI